MEDKRDIVEPGLPASNEKYAPIPSQWHLRCTHCDYDLTGLTYRRCPECGRRFGIDETMRLNKRTTWEFLFETRGTALAYPILVLLKRLGFRARTVSRLLSFSGPVFYTFLTLIGFEFIFLSMVDPLALFALFIWLPAEVFIFITRRGQGLFRLIIWIVCLLWAALMYYI